MHPKLLRGLLRRLEDARDVLADDQESDDEITSDDPMEQACPTMEIQELQESLATNIKCLFQMSLLVRKPAQHDLYLGSKRADVAASQPLDYNHVKKKSPRVEDALVKRLGNAITRRRMFLKYRERHALKLRQGTSNLNPGAHNFRSFDEGDNMGLDRTTVSDTVATDFEQRNIDLDDTASDAEISQTSYAPTLLTGGGEHIAIPPRPTISMGGVPFECPYCFYVIAVDGTHSCNKHVFQDLQPYICIAPTCTTPDRLYCTKREWLYHSATAHPIAATDDDTGKECKGVAICLLCKNEFEVGKQHDRHLAHHLQELALFILTGGEETSDFGEDEDAESNSNGESLNLAKSDDMLQLSEGLPDVPDQFPTIAT